MPYCQAVSWVIYTGSRQIVAMWITLGTFIITYFMKPVCILDENHKNEDEHHCKNS